MGANEKPYRKATDQHELEILSDLLVSILSDVQDVTGINMSRDILTAKHRLNCEGLSFATKTLPAFGKQILLAYRTGEFQRCRSFHSTKQRALPNFLLGLTELLFDIKSGMILDNPCYVAAWGIHQITSFLYKYEYPYSEKVLKQVLDQLLEVDKTLPRFSYISEEPLSYKREAILTTASDLLGEVFSEFNPEDIFPKHGPGSTNEGSLNQYDKYKFRPFDELLGGYYPEGVYTSPSAASTSANNNWGLLKWKPQMVLCEPPSTMPGESSLQGTPELRTAIVHAVPKDSRGPRIISAEPKELMWIQQGLNRSFVELFESHVLTAGHVNFTSQDINRVLAREGSATGLWATIDMKEASDRVSLYLVGRLLPSDVFAALWACRSQYGRVTRPSSEGETVTDFRLRKFAPMGSAVCFPIEAIIFWALTVAELMCSAQLSKHEAIQKLFVYGDDIIVPSAHADGVISTLDLCGLLVNHSKSYEVGPFRESCGMDAFLGVDITPVRLKKRMPLDARECQNIKGWVDSANYLSRSGLTRTANRIFSYIESLIGTLPLVPENTDILGRVTNKPIWEYLPKARERAILKTPTVFGNGFAILSIDQESFMRPNTHGYILRGQAVVTKTYKPTTKEFPEEHAYLAYMTTKANGSHVVEDVRTFARRNVSKLEYVTRVIG